MVWFQKYWSWAELKGVFLMESRTRDNDIMVVLSLFHFLFLYMRPIDFIFRNTLQSMLHGVYRGIHGNGSWWITKTFGICKYQLWLEVTRILYIVYSWWYSSSGCWAAGVFILMVAGVLPTYFEFVSVVIGGHNDIVWCVLMLNISFSYGAKRMFWIR